MFRFLRRPGLLLFLLALLPPAVQAQRLHVPSPFHAPPPAPAPTRPTGSYRSHQYRGGILTVRTTTGTTLRVQAWAPGVVRVTYLPAGPAPSETPSVSVVQAPGLAPAAPPREGPDRLEWTPDPATTLVLDKKTLGLRYAQPGTGPLIEAGSLLTRTATGRTPGSLGVAFRLTPEERLYGTGSRALPLDRRGRRLTLYNEAHYGYQNGEPTLNVSLPTVVSSRGYLLFFDNHAPGTLDLGATDKNTLEYAGEGLASLTYFLVLGSSYPELLARYTALTGRQPLPPRWALGLIQSRFGYKSEQEMLQVAGRMRRAGFPLDALVLDLYWFGGTSQQGNFRWVRPEFPDPARLMRRLDSMGVKTVLITEPYIMRTSLNDQLVREQGLVGRDTLGRPYTVESFWAGPATLLDMFRPRTRQWLWQQVDRLKQDGVAGWWSDLGEPENQPADMVYDLGPTRQIHNAYGQAWASILQEGYARHYPQERLFNLARSGWAGMQRHSMFPWSGDVSRSWSGLQAQVPIMLSMGLGGVGYMHSDAGGFAGNTTDPELYTRWLQMASLGPVLRPHGAGTPPEPYWFPEPYQSYVREATRLRYRLLPYLYSLAWENTQTGTPLTRPIHYGAPYVQPESVLAATGTPAPAWSWNTAASSSWGREQLLIRQRRAFAAQNTPALGNVNDQFLLGPSLLVAPVLQPGQRRRNVVLPAGTWVDFFTHETVPGGRTVGRPAPLARVPVLVRAGAFLPLTPYVPTTAAYRPDTLQVRYYADAAAGPTSFTLYEDDGHSAQPDSSGQFQLLTFRGLTTATQADITVVVTGQPYEGAPGRRTVELLLPRVAADPSALQLNGALLPPTGWEYNSGEHTLLVRFPLEVGTPVRLRISGLQLLTTPAPDLAPDRLTLEAPDNRVFGGSTELRYTLHQPGAVGELRIFNSLGELVRTLPTAPEAGSHRLRWHVDDAQQRPVPGGVYWAELAGQRQRLIVVR